MSILAATIAIITAWAVVWVANRTFGKLTKED